MASATATETKGNKTEAKAPRARREPPAIDERMKNQLTTGVLKGKVTADQLEALESHIGKLKGILSND